MIILLCRWDYLKITNEKKESLVGPYCGERTGERISVTGGKVVLTFRSDGSVQKKGFRLSFTSGPPGKNR